MPPMTISQYLAIGKLVGILAAIAIICWQSSQIHKWHQQSDHCAAARQADRTTYETAQRQAAQQNQAHVQQIEQQYQGITDNAKDAYARDHAELVRMRAQRDAALKGSAGQPGASPAHTATSGPHGDGVQVPAAVDLQTQDDAADIELRLLHLQNYVEKVLAVDPNK